MPRKQVRSKSACGALIKTAKVEARSGTPSGCEKLIKLSKREGYDCMLNVQIACQGRDLDKATKAQIAYVRRVRRAWHKSILNKQPGALRL